MSRGNHIDPLRALPLLGRVVTSIPCKSLVSNDAHTSVVKSIAMWVKLPIALSGTAIVAVFPYDNVPTSVNEARIGIVVDAISRFMELWPTGVVNENTGVTSVPFAKDCQQIE